MAAPSQTLPKVEAMKPRQTVSHLTSTVQGEPIFDNWRFTFVMEERECKRWMNHMKVLRVRDVIDGNNARLFTDAEIAQYTLTQAPQAIPEGCCRGCIL